MGYEEDVSKSFERFGGTVFMLVGGRLFHV
jgi:hypothetical protein